MPILFWMKMSQNNFDYLSLGIVGGAALFLGSCCLSAVLTERRVHVGSRYADEEKIRKIKEKEMKEAQQDERIVEEMREGLEEAKMYLGVERRGDSYHFMLVQEGEKGEHYPIYEWDASGPLIEKLLDDMIRDTFKRRKRK
jgi:hypothetical protein